MLDVDVAKASPARARSESVARDVFIAMMRSLKVNDPTALLYEENDV